MGKRSRRTFIQLFSLGIVAGLGFIWNKLTLNHLKQLKQKTHSYPFNKNKPVFFADNFIIVNRGEGTKVFSARCSHLGCTINEITDNKLVCPCHGSEYDLDGKVLKGPAYKNLHELPATISADETQIEIDG